MTTLKDIRSAPIAHTDAGELLFLGEPISEVELRGKITGKRAGLFVLDIQGERFTASKQAGFSVGDEVTAILKPVIKDGQLESLVVRSLLR